MIDADELARFIAVPAPTGSEEARIAWLDERLSGQLGSLARDDVGNLLWRFGGAAGSPELLLMAHVDTVFHGLDTIEVVREGDDLIGAGVGDNAAAVMTLVWASSAWTRFRPGSPSRSPWARRASATCAAHCTRAVRSGRRWRSRSRGTTWTRS